MDKKSVREAFAAGTNSGILLTVASLLLAFGVGLTRIQMADIWSDGVFFTISLTATAAVAAVGYLMRSEGRQPSVEQSAIFVAGIFLSYIAIQDFASLLKDDYGFGTGSVIFATFSALAALPAVFRNSTVCTNVAGIGAALAFIAFIKHSFDPESAKTYHWVLTGMIAAYVAAAWLLRKRAAEHAVQLVNVAALISIALGVVFIAEAGIGVLWFTIGDYGFSPAAGWQFLMFAITAGLTVFAMRTKQRGTAYLAFLMAIVTILVIISVKPFVSQFVDVDDLPVSKSISGWSLGLFIFAGLSVVAAFMPGTNRLKATQVLEAGADSDSD